MTGPITFTAAGDCFITRRLPEKASQALALQRFLMQADVRFANLEVTTHNREGIPSPVSGGTWAMAEPGVLDDLSFYGFNMLNGATNHALDYLYGGLHATEEHVKNRDFVYAGTGANLADASAPSYLETPNGRVALIACTSTFFDFWAAGDQGRDMAGRPGVNPVRVQTVHRVSREDMDALQRVAQKTDVNADTNLAVKEGFLPPQDDKRLKVGNLSFEEGSPSGTYRSPHPADKDRLLRKVKEARRQADVVLVSIHSHEMDGEDKAAPADFHKDLAHSLVDAGADSIISHGPHILRGIELYQGRPIFYSLGNFIFQNDSVTHLPPDFFEKYSLDDKAGIADALDIRSDYGRKGLGVNPEVWRSVVPYWEMENGELTKLTLHPIELGFHLPRYRKGWPAFSEDRSTLEHLRNLSAPFGTTITINKNGAGEAQV
ncbi:CapA family protein [Salibacterium halotolerans]|uniref:Poly-gamma-glutamate synthesis protein (Capsule biosynthesis protein) n=1 Tax=Salibacterium halotolerans TaxID=1884432 RepID=A0A1I5L091_9BACI|nr:CapA family protein [Salibacterium halotolerans]SFO90759.1 poly-gamma-glutamate synthesis protein (capsule biosynthesis protein) [Salibacterium halotolerans]